MPTTVSGSPSAETGGGLVETVVDTVGLSGEVCSELLTVRITQLYSLLTVRSIKHVKRRGVRYDGQGENAGGGPP